MQAGEFSSNGNYRDLARDWNAPREPDMTTTTILIVAAITMAFLLFGAVLAWADFYCRRAPTVVPRSTDASEAAATIDHRKAA